MIMVEKNPDKILDDTTKPIRALPGFSEESFTRGRAAFFSCLPSLIWCSSSFLEGFPEFSEAGLKDQTRHHMTAVT